MLSPSRPIEAIELPRSLRPLPAAARRACIVFGAVALLIAALLLAWPSRAATPAIRGEATLSAKNGYARLVIRFPEPVEARVRSSSNILIVEFSRPVDVAVDRINVGLADWISVARHDPDGKALRFALARKFRVNPIAAGERLFIDLLPENWTGDPPGLPQEVVEDLARRAAEAERLVRETQRQAEQPKVPPVRVRVAIQPSFTRYIFELPDLTGVTTARGAGTLTLAFAQPLEFDLADAKLAAVAAVRAVDAKRDQSTATVTFDFAGTVDVRSFREDFNFVVDVTPIDSKAARTPSIETPQIAVAPVRPPPAAPPPKVEDKPGSPAPAAAPAPAVAPPPAAITVPPPDPNRPVVVELARNSSELRLSLPFAAPTPAAAFQRGDVLWLVFDTAVEIDVAALNGEASRTVRRAVVTRIDDATVVRITLERPRLSSLSMQGNAWFVTIGETVQDSTQPLAIARNIVAPGRNSIVIPFQQPARLHRLIDPDLNDTLFVITGLGPARGLVKSQDFIELRALATSHGIAVQFLADDLKAEIGTDKVVISRPGGLILSAGVPLDRRGAVNHAVTFDTQLWNADRAANFGQRQDELIRAAAEAPFTRRAALRRELARFYLAWQMYPEAKAVLDVAIADERPTAADPSPLVLRAIANVMLGRLEAGLKDLNDPVVGNQNDAPLWRALILARQGKWPQARDQFRQVETTLTTLPLQLQRVALKDSLRALVETGDFAGAVVKLNDFDIIGVPAEFEPAVSVLTGRLAERLGRNNDAFAAYRFAIASNDGPAAAQARLREIALRASLGELKAPEVIEELERLTIGWRGDETELEALQMLARLYTAARRYREAFHAMRIAVMAHSNADVTRTMQSEAAKTFDALFMAGEGDALPAVDALSLFYDYRELAPIGRRGDEMIRRLADRLVSVDLLDQAAELLQYQVDNRLQGVARAQVAMRLAVIYLLNRKPDKAEATLRATRTADLSSEARSQRLLLEGRAISDLGRHDLALEVIAQVEGREAIRLRADIHWSARRWQKAAEQIELLYAHRSDSFEPLTDLERSDILRAGIGYTLADDKIGLARLREKFAAKMVNSPDARAFAVVTGGIGANSPEFRAVASAVAAVDTLDGFLREIKARFRDINGLANADPNPTGSVVR